MDILRILLPQKVPKRMVSVRPRPFLRGFKSRILEEHSTADLFNYTTGRWLWREKEQLLERYRRFNVRELQAITAHTLGSQACVSMSKIGEGNFNKVFRLVMDDGAVAIARIPHPNAGPPRYTTMSEVATMEFVSLSCTVNIWQKSARVDRSA